MLLDTIFPHGIGVFLLVLFRVLGLLMVAPLFAVRLVPMRIRLALGVGVAAVLSITLPPVPAADGWPMLGWIVVQETLIGAVMGFGLQLVFDALIIAGQTIAMSMGLGFAMLVDTQHGASVPVLSQFFVIVGTLVFLVLDGHLATLQLLADSFQWLPIGRGLSVDSLWMLLSLASAMFAGAVRVALPAIVAILIVNIAFGITSRAAPTLNLFAIGFPATLLLGFMVLIISIKDFATVFGDLLAASLGNLSVLLSSAG